MISIVVCSVNDDVYHRFSINVSQTIGVPFEIIRINNKQNKYSICSAYNTGKTQCQYGIICFIHEDVLIHTANWGKVIIELFGDPSIGIAGVLGACYVSLFPDYLVDYDECQGRIIDGSKEGHPIHETARFAKIPAEVVAIDGVFMVTRKSVISQYHFSDDILTGFHGYDFDICMQVRQRFKLVVTNEILMTHFSSGSFNSSYFDTYKTLYKKWRRDLPAYVQDYTREEVTGLKLKSLEKLTIKSGVKINPIIRYLKAFNYATRQGVLWHWLRLT